MALETIQGYLASEKLETRYVAIRLLSDLGPRAGAAAAVPC